MLIPSIKNLVQLSLSTFNMSDAFDYEIQRLTHPPITLYSRLWCKPQPDYKIPVTPLTSLDYKGLRGD